MQPQQLCRLILTIAITTISCLAVCAHTLEASSDLQVSRRLRAKRGRKPLALVLRRLLRLDDLLREHRQDPVEQLTRGHAELCELRRLVTREEAVERMALHRVEDILTDVKALLGYGQMGRALLLLLCA